jgi:hypothetical protein
MKIYIAGSSVDKKTDQKITEKTKKRLFSYYHLSQKGFGYYAFKHIQNQWKKTSGPFS